MIYEMQKFKRPNIQFYGLYIDFDMRILIYQMPTFIRHSVQSSHPWLWSPGALVQHLSFHS